MLSVESTKLRDLESLLNRDVPFPFRTCVFDISGVITDANLVFLEKLSTAMQFAELDNYDVGFQQLILAFGSNTIPNLMSDHGVPPEKQDVFWRTWVRIPESVPGRIRVFPDVVPVLHSLIEKYGVVIRIASRLYKDNLTSVFEELQRMGYTGKEDAELHGPEDDNERLAADCMDGVFERALEGTPRPRMYVDDTLDRIPTIKRLDPDIYCVGSTRGFFGRPELFKAGADKVIRSFYEILPLDEVEEKVIEEMVGGMESESAVKRMWKILLRRGAR